jgi:aryl-alcohol dehydrogenase-like predicted oxidoreductase
MQYTTLGNSGLVVSRLCMGAMTFGTGEFRGFRFALDQKAASGMVSGAIDAGVNFFDTADMYAQGQSEELLGKALAGKRKDVVISSKAGGRMGTALTNAGISYRHIISAAEASLKRLGTDYVDVYHIHFYDRITPIEESLRALDDLVRRGLVRYAAYSNLPVWMAAKAVAFQKYHNLAPFISAQLYYSLVGRDIELDIVPFLEDAGVGMMVWSPLAGGFLSGKYTRKDPSGGGGRLSKFDFIPVDKEHGYNVVDALSKMGRSRNATAAQVSLAWLLSKPYVSTVIIGATSMSQLEENLGAADVALTADEIEALDRLSPPALTYPHWMYRSPTDPVHAALKLEGKWPAI